MPVKNKYLLPVSVFTISAFVLSMVQLKVETPMLLLERFIKHGGWLEIILISSYGAFIAYKMQNINESAKWRLRSWTVFSIFFFSQLLLGIVISDKFLLTGKLHIPVPAMIISGPIYRAQLSVMSLLFISTLILSGPAWCSHLCYFGAIDGIVAAQKKGISNAIFKHLFYYKGSLLFILIFATLCLRWLKTDSLVATIIGISFGIVGLIIILTLSRKKGKMVHCLSYCPVGTLVNLFKWVSPFRMYIDETSCTMCMRCTPVCKYDALNLKDLELHKPGITCTLCGDCLGSCKDNSIKYQFLKENSKTSRWIYLFITISLHTIFIALGRI